MVDPTEVAGYVTAAKSAVDIMKSVLALMPKGENKDALKQKITDVEQALKRTDAKLAHELGYKLCQCTFPPQIMLWKEKEKLYACPNQDCGRTMPRGMPVSDDVLRSTSQQPRERC